MYANSCLATCVSPTRSGYTAADLVNRLNTRRFAHGRGTDREEVTIPTFVMVANTINRQRPEYSPRDLERLEQPVAEDDSDDSIIQQKVSVAPDSDKVVHSVV